MIHSEGAYKAGRAAALAGVPKSTLHYWSKHDILVPSVSPVRIKLWSFSDLMAARMIEWLRRNKNYPSGVEVSRSSMPAIKEALKQLDELDLSLWTEDVGPTVSVTRGGQILLDADPDAEAAHRQRVLDGTGEMFTISSEFTLLDGSSGPDLHAPRPELRIVPGKLSGSPHVVDTRLETSAVGSLALRGVDPSKIYDLYPEVEKAKIDQAIDLERQLATMPVAA